MVNLVIELRALSSSTFGVLSRWYNQYQSYRYLGYLNSAYAQMEKNNVSVDKLMLNSKVFNKMATLNGLKNQLDLVNMRELIQMGIVANLWGSNVVIDNSLKKPVVVGQDGSRIEFSL